MYNIYHRMSDFKLSIKLNTTLLDLIHGLFLLGAGIGFIMALSEDVALFDIPSES